MSVRHVVCLGVAAACVMPAAGFAQQETGEAERNWSRVSQCGAIADDERRLDCMDDVLRAAGVMRGGTSGATPPQAARPGDTVPAARSGPASRTSEPATTHTESLATTIASVQTIGYQRLLVTTAEGSVWEQTQAETFRTPAKAGDAFSVEPAAMGSFRCRFNQSSRYRCRQVN